MSYIKIVLTRYMSNALKRLGLVIKRTRDIDVLKKQYLNAMQVCMNCPNDRITDFVVGIVFSKDRPMQLYALIKSYFENVSSPGSLEVLFHASNQEYLDAYLQVQVLCKDYDVKFTKESSFKDDLVQVLSSLEVTKVFFLVDDILFIRHMDMSFFMNVDLNKHVPSMRLGTNLKRCYTQNVRQPLPLMKEYEKRMSNSPMFSWSWVDGMFDWAYPLSVDGNVFLLEEILAMAKIGEYRAPNTFEQSLQWFSLAFSDRYGLCGGQSFLVNIPFNKVQCENSNVSSNVSEKDLLISWCQGNEIDVSKYYGLNNVSAHQELPLHIVQRKDIDNGN